MLDCFVLLSAEPTDSAWFAIFRSDAGGPGEFIVDLDKVVILCCCQYICGTHVDCQDISDLGGGVRILRAAPGH